LQISQARHSDVEKLQQTGCKKVWQKIAKKSRQTEEIFVISKISNTGMYTYTSTVGTMTSKMSYINHVFVTKKGLPDGLFSYQKYQFG
jgi:hypothetical protein